MPETNTEKRIRGDGVSLIDSVCSRKYCVAIIAEKPKSAYKIYQALGPGRKLSIENIPVYMIDRTDRVLVIIPAAGHLFTLSTETRGYPVYDYKWVPRYLAEKGYGHLVRFHRVFSRIMSKMREYINACDYDIEGSVIGYMIIKHWGDVKRAKRMKFSTLTKEDIVKSFNSLNPLDIEMIEAGLARHELDWIWGINISRAITDLYNRKNNQRKILSAGRVQTPTLFEALKRYVSREVFVPEPLYRIRVKSVYKGLIIDFEDEGEPLRTRTEALKLKEEILSRGFIDITEAYSREIRYDPPHPFNLGDLQEEAYAIYGITPYETLKILEDLYLEGLISYPRTNSQKLPETLDNKGIIQNLSRIPEYRVFAQKLLQKKILRPNNGEKEDLAHPAIYPTGEIPGSKLSAKHRRLYDLVVRRYLATFYDDLVIKDIQVRGCVRNRCFRASGRKILEKGWYEVYYFHKISENIIPEISKGISIPILEIKIVKTYTKPPILYDRATLLRWMENENIGTEATRAEIIETLFKRGYLSGRRIKVTKLGFEVVSILEKYFSELLSPDLTRKFEIYLTDIMMGKRRREEVVNEAIKTVGFLIEKFKNEMIHNMNKDLSKEKCAICDLEKHPDSEYGFCKIHEEALRNLSRAYKSWEDDGYDWNTYLDKVYKSKLTGKFVKDVINYLYKKNYS
ncbi:MAG: DNA topoisomerase I [Sulfolobales archaeon]